jgi:hypothetical protein
MNPGEPPKTQPDPDPAFDDLLAAVKVLATCAEEHESDESHECRRYCLELWWGHECRRYCEYNPLRIAALVMDRLGLENTDLAEVGRQLLEREMEREQYRRNIYCQWLMNQ